MITRTLQVVLVALAGVLVASRGTAETPKDAFIRQATAALQQVAANPAPRTDGLIGITLAVAYGDKMHGPIWQGTIPAGTTLSDLAANPSQFNIPHGLVWPQGFILILHRGVSGVQRATFKMQNVTNSRAFPRVLADHDVILAEVLTKR